MSCHRNPFFPFSTAVWATFHTLQANDMKSDPTQKVLGLLRDSEAPDRWSRLLLKLLAGNFLRPQCQSVFLVILFALLWKSSLGEPRARRFLKVRTGFQAWALSFDIQAAESGLFTKYSNSQNLLTKYSSYPVNVLDHLPWHKIFNTHNVLLLTR